MSPRSDPTPEFISLSKGPVRIGRSRRSTVRLLHPTISREHAVLESHDSSMTIQDQASRFGTFVNGKRVKRVSLKDGDRIRFGSSITYRVEASGLKHEPSEKGVSLVASDLAVRHKGRNLVENVSCEIPPDSFMGLLGPSGCGKSLILKCLATYQRPSAGTVRCDGRLIDEGSEEAYRSVLGYVPQDDVVYTSLTVRENLAYAAQLRLKSSINADKAVERVIEQLELGPHAEKQAGVLSGGQRKRLSVAIELLRRPQVLLLDEPTSGLDPATEANLMGRLRYLASQGTTIVCTTHLMENTFLFDSVLVLGLKDQVGCVAYRGESEKLLEYFECSGFADMYEKISQGDFEPVRDPPSTASVEQDDQDVADSERLSREQSGASSELATHGVFSLDGFIENVVRSKLVKQFGIISRRAALVMRRDRQLLAIMGAQPLFLGFLVCLTQFKPLSRTEPIWFFAAVIAVWLGLNNSARDLVRERDHYVRDRISGVNPTAYLGAKATVFVLAGLLQLVLLLVIIRFGCYSILLVTDEAAARLVESTYVFWTLSVLMLCYLGGLGLGLLVSSTVGSQETAVAVLPLILMPQLLLSGMATNYGGETYSKPRTCRPLVVTVQEKSSEESEQLPVVARVADGLSMACFTRPGTIVLGWTNKQWEHELRGGGYARWIWLADLLHLVILVLGTWLAATLVFLSRERHWIRSVGLE